jgi:transcriptional regulator with XRE-family HTH domain
MMETAPSPAFATLLWRYRQAAGLSQEELAARARLNVRTVGDLERGGSHALRKMLPPPVEQFGITAEADARWVRPKLVAQPFRTYQEPVRLTNAAARALPRTYMYCTVGPWTSIFAPFARKAQAEGWRYRELATGHAAPLLEPQNWLPYCSKPWEMARLR